MIKFHATAAAATDCCLLYQSLVCNSCTIIHGCVHSLHHSLCLSHQVLLPHELVTQVNHVVGHTVSHSVPICHTTGNAGLTIWERICRLKQPVIEPRESAHFAAAIDDYRKKLDNPEYNGAVMFAVCRGKVRMVGCRGSKGLFQRPVMISTQSC